MQLCPQCGYLNAERAKFCSECGTKLAAVVSIDPPSETPPAEPEPIDRLDAPAPTLPPAPAPLGKTQSEFGEPNLLDRIELELDDDEESRSPSTLDETPSEKLPPTPVVPVPSRQPEPAAPTPLPPLPAPAAPGRTTPKLHVIRGERIDIEYPIYPGKNYIGRTDEKPVDIDLEDQERSDKIWSSRQHAIIHFENGVLMIEDLNSLNGTFVNRVRLLPGQTRTLRGNDVVQIGTVQLKVVFS